MVLPGSCCPLPGFVPLPQAGPLRPAAPPRRRPCPLLLFRSLFGLALLQTGLGCALMALCFGALSLSSAPQVKNACPLWAGSSAVLCGILGLTTWKRPMRLLVNLFVLLSVISFMLNVTGLILGCQGIQFVSRVPRCNLVMFFCSWKAILTDLICVVYCSTPVSDVISLHYTYVIPIRGAEVYCPLDPPPPYETVCSLKSSEQGGALQINGVEDVDSGEVSDRQSFQAEEIQEPSSRVSFSPSNASCVPEEVNRRAFNPLWKCSKSDPVLLHCQLPQGTVLNSETATLNDVNPLNAVTLQKSSRAKASRGRPQSLIDYKSYMDTKQRVAWVLEQSCSMSPDIHDLVENIKSVLKSDEKHMAEAVASATFLEQVMIPAQQATSESHVLPSRLHPGLLYLESCGDLSIFITEGEQLAERRIQRAEHERTQSVIGVLRETVL
ncbi:LOW QUALITY PROTEIN: endosomal transmembrane epsin interactor 1 [Vidua macroura]|uniref:LOW QUALITY PROTEIN: endosomal transmembrane epsin interactor 1 n=1 Tax=Vidua macroura TaxID=187451 RepID=UPI0023A817F5|nr:LOW QUALITY PROTEIN: endosomal transmembrane epsin interactor 1 [Vidua macroura]